MDRSSRHGLRSERISNSPYKRPQPSELKKSTSSTFSTVKSIFSYALSPLFRSSSSTNLTLPTTTADLRQIDQKSESGSEDGWNGEPPVIAEGNGAMSRSTDLFDLAAAGGRSGQDFEERAARWRAQGEVPGGRRDMARRSLEGLPTPDAVGQPTFSQPNGRANVATNSNGFASFATPSNTLKRSLQANTLSEAPSTSLSAVPTRSFLPPALTPGRQAKSASSAALAAFLDAKKDAPLTEEDLRVIDTLTHSLHVEAGSPQRSSDPAVGGWSAGTPRAIKSTSRLQDSPFTPARSANGSSFPTPNSAFNVGPSTSQSPAGASPYRQRYLGVGMSPRRMLGKQRSGAGIKPLFQLSLPSDDPEESVPKKRKVDRSSLEVEIESEVETPESNARLSQSVSMPELASSTQSTLRADVGKKADSRRHPLSQSTVVSEESSPSHVVKGKKRAADIMRQLIEEQIAPVEAAKATGALTSDIIINPYDTPSAKALSPADTRVYDSPRKSLLRASVRDTPKRGAAAKLELHRSTGPVSPSKSPLSSKIDSRKFAPKPVESKTPAENSMEVDELSDGEPAAESGASAAAPSRAPEPIKAPEPFKPYDVPALDTPSRPLPTFTPVSTSRLEDRSPSSYLNTFQSVEEPAPKFSLPALKPIAPVEDESVVSDTINTVEPKAEDRFDPSKIWMSSKETALAVQEAALPFFTFDIAIVKSDDTEEIRKVKAAAMKAQLSKFDFTVSSSSVAPAPVTPFQWPAGSAPKAAQDEWTCSICIIKNKNAADKCAACEGPRPANVSSSSKSSSTSSMPALAPAPFKWPAGSAPKASNDEWTCSICLIKNKNVAEKCAACEGPRPASAAPSLAATATPFQWPAGTAPKAATDEWTCSICLIKNKNALEKCAACEGPRPAGISTSNVAPTGAAPAPTPFTWPGGGAPKTDNDHWTCSLCMLKSPASATKCVVCENPRG